MCSFNEGGEAAGGEGMILAPLTATGRAPLTATGGAAGGGEAATFSCVNRDAVHVHCT